MPTLEGNKGNRVILTMEFTLGDERAKVIFDTQTHKTYIEGVLYQSDLDLYAQIQKLLVAKKDRYPKQRDETLELLTKRHPDEDDDDE